MTIANDGSTPLVAPVAVRQVDVEAGVDDLRLGASRSGRPYRSLLAIARGRNGPLATASFEVPAGGVLPRDLLIAGLRQRVKAVGEPWPDVVTAADAPGAARQDVRAPAVSVVIATCRNPSALERCVGSILGSDYDNFDVIVVENAPGSSASQQMLASRFPDDPRIRDYEELLAAASADDESWLGGPGSAYCTGFANCTVALATKQAGLIRQKKSKARLASPQSRPTSPAYGAGGNSRLLRRLPGPGVVPGLRKYFSRVSDTVK